MVDQTDLSWFVAQLKPNSARIAERNLARQGFETFLPRESRTVRRGARFVVEEKPMFPGYAFVRLDIAGGSWRAVNSTLGVVRLVRFGQALAPSPLPDGLIAELRRRCDATGLLMPPEAWTEGQAVRVGAGPFADLLGRIVAVEPDRRIWVLLDILGGETRVSIDQDHLRRE